MDLQVSMNRKVLTVMVAGLLLLVIVYFLIFCSLMIDSKNSVDVGEKNNRLKYWFFAFDGGSSPGYKTWAKIAVLSALNETSLKPVMMLSGEDQEMKAWMRSHNVIVVSIDTEAFYMRIKHLNINGTNLLSYIRDSKVLSGLGIGTWLRILVPDVIDEMVENKLVSEHIQYILYTDIDVVFVKDVFLEKTAFPKVLSFPIQGDAYYSMDEYNSQYHINAGVAVMNVVGYRKKYANMIEYLVRHQNSDMSDQRLFNDYFPPSISFSIYDFFVLLIYHKKIWDSLFSVYHSSTLNKVYEWEPYLGSNTDAVIIHWHGPKPRITCGADLVNLAVKDPSGIFGYLSHSELDIQRNNSKYHYLMRYKTAFSGYKYYLESYLHYYHQVCKHE